MTRPPMAPTRRRPSRRPRSPSPSGRAGRAGTRSWPAATRPDVADAIGCPCCGNLTATALYDFSENPWLPGRVVRCEDCSFLFKRPTGGVEAITELYLRDDFALHDYW